MSLRRLDDATTPRARAELLTKIAFQASQTAEIRAEAHWWSRLLPATQARAILSRVQALPYLAGDPGEWVEDDPRVTLERGGECKAKSVLLAAIALALGIPVRLVWVEQTGAPYNHLTVLLTVGSEELWAETTIPGAQLGEHPSDARERLGPRSR